jgi:hypothetical protein
MLFLRIMLLVGGCRVLLTLVGVVQGICESFELVRLTHRGAGRAMRDDTRGGSRG